MTYFLTNGYVRIWGTCFRIQAKSPYIDPGLKSLFIMQVENAYVNSLKLYYKIASVNRLMQYCLLPQSRCLKVLYM